MQHKTKSQDFYNKLVRIALPIVAQEFIIMALNLVDIMMIGQKGEVAVASAALANQITFILIILMFGVGSSASVFAAQYWGKKDVSSIRKIVGISLIIAISSATVIVVLSRVFPQQIIGLYSNDPQVIALGGKYLQIACLGYIPMAITSSFSAALRSTENVRLPMVTSIIALTINTFLNYCLIFGNFGFPEIGVLGASIATVTSRIIECLIIVFVTYRFKTPVAGKINEFLSFNRDYLIRYIKIGSPVILNELVWVLGISIYNMVYAHISTESIAAYNISSSIEGLAFTLFIGLSHASAIIIGNQIGAEKYDLAFYDAKKALKLAAIGAVGLGIIEILISSHIVSVYQISESAYISARNLLIISGAVLWMRACNMLIYIGIIRSGGDTRFGLFTELVTIWLIGVPLALIGAFVFHLNAPLVYAMVTIEEAVKLVIGFRRLHSKKWIHNLVSHSSTLT
ncbi:MAG: MATE family efflux transporter [Anaerolineaceae bacterium]|nr:MATE family efflux transporter [Anaerolineaceae bacterium]